jgi:hypothetical protein
MILGFQTDEGDLTATANRIIEILLWNFWPRMMRDAPAKQRFACRVMVEDQELPIPEPEEFAPFDLLCRAMRRRGSARGTMLGGSSPRGHRSSSERSRSRRACGRPGVI